MKIAVYPGSFDPITYGHLDVIKRATKIFDRVILAVAEREEKNPIFTHQERVELAKKVLGNNRQVSVEGFSGLLISYLKKRKVSTVIRGLRAVMDFDYEFQMVLTNRKLAPEIDTVFFLPSEQYFYLSASLVKEIARLKGELKCFVPKIVEIALRKKFQIVHKRTSP